MRREGVITMEMNEAAQVITKKIITRIGSMIAKTVAIIAITIIAMTGAIVTIMTGDTNIIPLCTIDMNIVMRLWL